MASPKVRILVAALSLSAGALIGRAVHEGYTDRAVIPTAGDVPTLGFGSTVHESGERVAMGDRTDPVRALITLQAHASKDEQGLRDSLPNVQLTQDEFDLYADWIYQYGLTAWRSSSMRRELLAGQYRTACEALLDYRFLTSSTPMKGWEAYTRDGRTRWRFDCSTPGNKTCRGVWTRQQERHRKCLEAQP